MRGPDWLNPSWAEPLGMLLLRIGVAWFIFVWAVNKFFAPGQYQFILKRFDKIEAELWTVYGIAIAQTVVCVLVFLGLWRLLSYGALMLIHAGTIYRIWPRLIDPFEISDKGFPVNRNSAIALGIFLAMVALLLLRNRDAWSLDHWMKRRRGGD
ncbi:MAG: hypothetical protein AAF439_05645 [Pseudomonadota bacterium]